MSAIKDKPRFREATAAGLYGRDFFAWTLEQSDALENRRPGTLDWSNLAEEVRSLGNSEQNEIESRLLVLLAHLLKWSFQPDRKPGWAGTIREQRRRIARRVLASPSLAGYPAEVLADEYADARFSAADETGLALTVFPETCPFTVDQALDPDFWPDGPPA